MFGFGAAGMTGAEGHDPQCSSVRGRDQVRRPTRGRRPAACVAAHGEPVDVRLLGVRGEARHPAEHRALGVDRTPRGAALDAAQEARVPLGRVRHRRAEQWLDLARERPPRRRRRPRSRPHRHRARRTGVDSLRVHGRDSDCAVRPGRLAECQPRVDVGARQRRVDACLRSTSSSPKSQNTAPSAGAARAARNGGAARPAARRAERRDALALRRPGAARRALLGRDRRCARRHEAGGAEALHGGAGGTDGLGALHRAGETARARARARRGRSRSVTAGSGPSTCSSASTPNRKRSRRAVLEGFGLDREQVVAGINARIDSEWSGKGPLTPRGGRRWHRRRAKP